MCGCAWALIRSTFAWAVIVFSMKWVWFFCWANESLLIGGGGGGGGNQCVYCAGNGRLGESNRFKMMKFIENYKNNIIITITTIIVCHRNTQLHILYYVLFITANYLQSHPNILKDFEWPVCFWDLRKPIINVKHLTFTSFTFRIVNKHNNWTKKCVAILLAGFVCVISLACSVRGKNNTHRATLHFSSDFSSVANVEIHICFHLTTTILESVQN